MTDDIAAIAEGLTKAQGEALCQGEAWSGRTRKALILAGLAMRGKTDFYKPFAYASPRYPFDPTPLGLEARAYLENRHG